MMVKKWRKEQHPSQRGGAKDGRETGEGKTHCRLV